MRNRNYYQRLSVNRNASSEEITTNFKTLAFIDNKNTQYIAEAYLTLINAESRRQYDLKLQASAIPDQCDQLINQFNQVLQILNNRITTISDLPISPDCKKLHDKFIQDLQSFYDEARESISKEVKDIEHIKTWQPDDFQLQLTHIQNLSIAKYINEKINPELKQLQFTPDSEDDDKAILNRIKTSAQEILDKNPAWENFGKALFTLCMSGLAFIVGLVTGFVIGNVAFPLIGSIAAIPAAFSFASDAFEDMQLKTKIPKDAFTHFLLFRTPNYSAIAKMAESGLKLAVPEKRDGEIPLKKMG